MNSNTRVENDPTYFDDPGPNDVEEGELPEEGEIMDDEEDERVHTDNRESSSSHRKSTSSTRTTEKVHSETTNNDSSSKQSSSLNVHESNTRKRHSSSPGVESYPPKRAAREPSPERFPPQLPPRRRQPWTEAILCKFFREGYCRDGDNCAYSHDAAHSNRKPELCKFYQQGFCKKGLACTLLHGEYPCKAFHQGKCDRSPCKYSHMPLNEYTQSIFDQMVQDEALAAQIVIPQQPARRKVLLPRPAPTAALPSTNPPAVNPVPEEKPIVESFDPMEDPDEKLLAEEAEPYPTFPQTQSTHQNPNGFSFGAMLEEMSNVKGAVEPTNPAGETWRAETVTPEERISPGNSKPELNTVYRLIPIADTDTDYDIDFLQKLSADRFKNDPRIQCFIQKQFDRASTMFGQNMPPIPQSTQDSSMTAVKVEKSAAARDPRMRPSSDPRQRPSAATTITHSPVSESLSVVPQIIETNFDVHAGIPLPSQPVTAMDEAHLKTLAEKQLQMIKGQSLQPESTQGGFGFPDTRYSDNRNYRSPPEHYNYERRDYPSGPRYDRGFDRGYNDSGSYESDYRSNRSNSRGAARGRGYYEGDRRDYHSKQNDRFDRWDSRGGADGYRRDRDKPSRSRMRSRSRSPRPSKSNEYQSPVARA
ncbi:hypothetical protein FO519_001671 [Halicephalobus sp. NKZ332]|nr:hypothetical protein FO519_001671 [Halicephalobus sp. NKZ332]